MSDQASSESAPPPPPPPLPPDLGGKGENLATAPLAHTQPRPRLQARLALITRDAESSLSVLVNEFPFLIGRDKSCHLMLSSPQISKQHCRISLENGTLVVEDLGSTNGTFVNKTRVEGIRPLVHDDVLLIGAFAFRASIVVLGPLADPVRQVAAPPEVKTERKTVETPRVKDERPPAQNVDQPKPPVSDPDEPAVDFPDGLGLLLPPRPKQKGRDRR